jgi:hypothetical protein
MTLGLDQMLLPADIRLFNFKHPGLSRYHELGRNWLTGDWVPDESATQSRGGSL